MSSVSEILKRAKDCERKGDWDGAIAEFRKMVNAEPCPPIACNLMGDLYHKKGDAAEAYEWYRKAIDNYAREDLYANAIGICRKVLRQESGREEMLERLGGLFFSQGFVREAVKHYLDYAARMAERGDSESVIETATRVREILADDPAVRERLGDVLAMVSRPAEAAGEYRAALDGFRRCEKEPESSRVAEKLEKAKGESGPAAPEPEGIAEDAGAEAPAWDCGSVGEIDSVDGIPPEGLIDPAGEEPEGESPAAEPVEPHEFEIPGATFENDSRLVSFHPPEEPGGDEPEKPGSEARDALDGLIGAFPEEPSSAEEIEILSSESESFQEGEIETEETTADPVLDQSPKPQEDFVPVEEILREFQNGVGKILDEEDYQSHYDMGMSYKEMGLFEEALAEFEQAAVSPEFSPSCGEMMGAVLLEIHRSEDAIQILRPLVDGGENDSLGVHYLLGKAYERLGQRDRALLEYRFVEEHDPNFRDVRDRIERVHR
ncbi:MAG: tetratricopeptide repeat protein [Candidatus Eisenbacteria bacterium]|nr:tetratricopeptide repeat protein [Candidatus Eisenbacteria bacterium]